MTIGYHHATGLIGMISYDPVSSAADNALNSADRWIAFSIIAPPAGDTPSKVMVYASGETGTVTTGISCEFYSDNAGVPGTSLDASTGMTANCAAGTWLEFTGFDVALTGGTLYWVVIKNTTGTPASNYPEIRSLTLMTPMYFANTGVNTMKTTADAGSTWTAATKTSCNNIRIQWGGGYSGFPVSTQAAASSTYGVYDKRELGVVFTTPAVGKMAVAGIAAVVSKTGTPTRALRLRLYEGVTLVDTTYSTAVANVTTRSWIQGYFSTVRVLKRNTTYRAVISVAYTGSGDGDTSNYFACYGYTIQDSNESRSLTPMRGWGGTYTADSSAGPVVFSESGLTTFVPQIVLLLDSDAGELAEPTQPAVGDVQDGVAYNDAASTGTLTLPTEAQVETGVTYGAGGTEFTGTLSAGGGVWMPRARQIGV